MVLPYIKMNLPQVYMCSPSWTLLPPPSPYHPSGSSQCTSPKHPVSCIEPGLATHFIYDIIHIRNSILVFLCVCVCVAVTMLSSVQFNLSVMSDSLWPHESQHARPPCSSPTPGVHPNSCPLSRWCHPAISSPVVPFSSCSHSLPATGSFPMSQLFAWGGQSTGVSALASFLPKNTQGWSPLEWADWISLQSKGLSRVFSNTTVQKHQFFSAQLSSQSNSHIHTWPLENVRISNIVPLILSLGFLSLYPFPLCSSD